MVKQKMKWLTACNNIQGWMGVNELVWLYSIALQYDSIVEIGSWKGRSTYALCSANHAKITAVDHFLGNAYQLENEHREATERDIFVDYMQNCGHFTNLTTLKMDTIKASKTFDDNSVDVVFIDGDHTPEGILADLEAWSSKATKMICGHDYDVVADVLLSFFGDNKIHTVPNAEYGMWYVLKT